MNSLLIYILNITNIMGASASSKNASVQKNADNMDSEAGDVSASTTKNEKDMVKEGEKIASKDAMNKKYVCVKCLNDKKDSSEEENNGANGCCDCCCNDKDNGTNDPCSGGKVEPEVPCACLDKNGNIDPKKFY